MTDTEINIAIAEACGWKCHDWSAHQMPYWEVPKGEDPKGRAIGIPDYANDLNAMHQVEIEMGADTHEYRIRLMQLCYDTNTWATEATARHRAETFLKTKGLWKPKAQARNPMI